MKRLRMIFLVLMIAVFLGFGGYLPYGYLTSVTDTQSLKGLAMASAEGMIQNQTENDDSCTIQGEIIDLDVYLEPTPVLPQYEALHKQNTDMIGWIRIEGTKVDYPVMQAPGDREFYLHRNFEKEDAFSGLPFLDSRSDINEPTNSLLIYGHNMKNGTMFGELSKYWRKSFWEKRQMIQLDLLRETRTYEIIGMFRSRQYKEGETGFRYYDYIDLSDVNRFNEFIEQVKGASFIDTGVTACWGDQILMLSTCSYHVKDGTFVVVAKYTPLLCGG